MIISIYSSYQADAPMSCAFECDEAGRVLRSNVVAEFGPLPVHFDVAEYVRHYKKISTDIDILDIGYTLADGRYEPPVDDFRKGLSTGPEREDDADAPVAYLVKSHQ